MSDQLARVSHSGGNPSRMGGIRKLALDFCEEASICDFGRGSSSKLNFGSGMALGSFFAGFFAFLPFDLAPGIVKLRPESRSNEHVTEGARKPSSETYTRLKLDSRYHG